mgnify:FL=1|jgi:hypothetical protein|tara:strand:- start:741 stop:1043 length:303 start_codon:yes stop_codon:yes gene_type:complete
MKKINLFLIILIVLSSCGSFSEAGKILRNEKTNNTDEFLVKKRSPLVLPPDYKEIPEPDSLKKKSDENQIKKILNATKEENSNINKSSTIEKSILNRIRK